MEYKAQSQSYIKHHKLELDNLDGAKKLSEHALRFLKIRLEEKKNEISMITNPVFPGTQVPKNFLASERLASSKKKGSVSPEKFKIKDVKPKKSIRFKSASRAK